ncbi:Rossmann-like domain-containing protein [Kocuria tytonicola]|uniref:Rossmann-like domain-containing protein n=1 Tax=Kocuria tytonicola TaxID=2055946 RepID=UPI001F0CB257|nr:DUF364 domain-containing protein [Kocuria tytonicola]
MSRLGERTPESVAELLELAREHLDREHPGASDAPAPVARSVFAVQHGTRLAAETELYRNQYILVRVEGAFGGCAVEARELTPEIPELSGLPVRELLAHPCLPVRVAVLDAWLASRAPHSEDPRARRVPLPPGTPDERARARDSAVADLLSVSPGQRIALIGVVNPLVAALRARGAEVLPCDLALRETLWGDPVSRDMEDVLAVADGVLATGMTIGNGTFDRIRNRCLERGVPLGLYAQSAPAVAREFLGHGVTALSAEPFPFSQFSAEQTHLHVYGGPGGAGAGEPAR